MHVLNRGFVSYLIYFKNVINLLWDIATARLVFLNGACEAVSSIEKREETYVVQLWHACGALKKFGWSTKDLPYGMNQAVYRMFPPYRNYDLIAVSGEAAIRPFEEAMQYSADSNVVQALGVSRTDVFFNKKFVGDAIAHVKSVFPACEGKKIILYAPTFRGPASSPKSPKMPDFRAFNSRLKEDYIIIIKMHQILKDRPEIPRDLENSFVFEATDTVPIEELICASDICISDYSSVIFEFSLFNKPMIFYAYDYDDYSKCNGFYFPFKEVVPGPVFTNEEEILDYIEKLDQVNLQDVSAFRNRFMSACDGNSTERLIKYISDCLAPL